jgi:ParB-like chromosome segregation protein Spo0J
LIGNAKLHHGRFIAMTHDPALTPAIECNARACDSIKIHPAANLFPMMSEPEYQLLLDDIRVHGIRTPIVFLGDLNSPDFYETRELIDGRNRLRACKELGVGFRDSEVTVSTDEATDPIAYVLSLNLHRRHLSGSQRAMIAADVATMRRGANQHSSIDLSSSQAEAAVLLSVSVPSLKRAKRVKDNAVPEMIEAVRSGRVSVSAAAEASQLSADEQQRLLDAGPDSIKNVAADLRRARGHSLIGERTAPSSVPVTPTQAATNSREVKASPAEPTLSAQEPKQPIKSRGVGVAKAHDAINIIREIPRSDMLRTDAFDIVIKWCKDNHPSRPKVQGSQEGECTEPQSESTKSTATNIATKVIAMLGAIPHDDDRRKLAFDMVYDFVLQTRKAMSTSKPKQLV